MSCFVSRPLATALALAFPLAFALPHASAAPNENAAARMFGRAAPFTVQQLPPGRLRDRLETLPTQARARALNWLHTFSFPAADLNTLQVDDDGAVFYADTQRPDAAPVAAADAAAAPAVAPENVFKLHSRPGASRVLYLDVDGHTISNTAWNTGGGASVYNARAFSIDSDYSSFNADELKAIAEIWHRVAEDYAAFDIDVTTELPAQFTSTTGRILITPSTDASGTTMPSGSGGGVAYVNVFGQSNYGYYSPALVYSDNLGPNFAPYVAEAASHEAGHNMGLSHDGTSSVTYYGGHGSGSVDWAPIMGSSYASNVSQWSRGEYSGANNTQDDIALIAQKAPFKPDDHGNTIAAASALIVAADGSVVVTTPENDAFNDAPDNKGVIGTAADVDVFAFNAGAGTVDLTVNPAWAAFFRSSGGRGANLDIQARLLNAQGQVVAQNDSSTETHARVTASVAAGSYFLEVSGVGSSAAPYSDYASQGMYFVSGSVAAGVADTTAPTPDPMGWASGPAATGATSMTMTAATAFDESGAVQYSFDCVSGGAGCADSGWVSGATHTASGLAASTAYSWRVQARDLAGNATGWSGTLAATTDAAPPPPTAPAAPSGLAVSNGGSGRANLAWADNSANETGFRVIREKYNPKNRRWTNTTTVATLGANVTSYVNQSGAGTFRFRVEAYNSVGAATTGWVQVNVTN